MSKICCFTGNREIKGISPTESAKKLESVLIDLIENQEYTIFRAGGARGFDTLAALCVLKLKEKYPQIELHIYIPCKNQDKYFSVAEKKLYKLIIEHADKTFLLQENYSNAAMHARNRAMVDGSDVCVALMTKLTGGTYSTVRYARQKQVPVINLVRI